MGDVEELTTVPEEPETLQDAEAEAPTEKPPAPKEKPVKKPKKQLIVEIPVDPPPVDPPPPDAPGPAPVLERAVSSSAPAPKARGRPKGAVGAAKRAPPAAPPPTPREQEYSLEDHMALMLQHTRMQQENRRVLTREKYRSWVA